MSPPRWPTTTVTLDNGNQVAASAPLVISASRATDIPALYGTWLLQQLDNSYVMRTNPFNGKRSTISLENVRIIAFWTKNAAPFLPLLPELDKRGISCFFQYTLNNYQADGFEPGIPSLDSRINTFAELSRRIGKERLLWRFDPVILTPVLSPQTILRRITTIGDRIAPLCSRLTVSFLSHYASVLLRMRTLDIQPFDRHPEMVAAIGAGLAELGKRWGIPVVTCAEEADMSAWGILPGSCIDPDYIMSTFGEIPEVKAFFMSDRQQMLFTDDNALRSKFKDSGQRPKCNCMISKDIGEYGTCTLGCIYCYAGRACRNIKA